jgi:hypothetical protein
MSREKPFENRLPALYKKTAVDLIMFGYVLGLRRGLPAVTIQKALNCFLNDFGLEEDYHLESAKVSYFRITRDVLWCGNKDNPILDGYKKTEKNIIRTDGKKHYNKKKINEELDKK